MYANEAGYMIVDEMHEEHPELLNDQYWNEVVPKDLHHTVASEHYKVKQSDALYANVFLSEHVQSHKAGPGAGHGDGYRGPKGGPLHTQDDVYADYNADKTEGALIHFNVHESDEHIDAFFNRLGKYCSIGGTMYSSDFEKTQPESLFGGHETYGLDPIELDAEDFIELNMNEKLLNGLDDSSTLRKAFCHWDYLDVLCIVDSVESEQWLVDAVYNLCRDRTKEEG